MEGYAWRQSGYLRPWQKRYIVVKQEYLSYYKTEQQADKQLPPTNIIFFEHLGLSLEESNAANGARFCLRVTDRGERVKSHLIGWQTEDERDQWLFVILRMVTHRWLRERRSSMSDITARRPGSLVVTEAASLERSNSARLTTREKGDFITWGGRNRFTNKPHHGRKKITSQIIPSNYHVGALTALTIAGAYQATPTDERL